LAEASFSKVKSGYSYTVSKKTVKTTSES